MQKICFLILLILSPVSYAQKSLGKDTFQINVRPVLNGILNDFYQMIVLFPDFPKELIPLIEELDTLNEDKEALELTCPRLLVKTCATNIQALREKLKKTRLLSLSLQARQKMATTVYLNSLSGMRIIAQFDLQLEEIKGTLDNVSFLQTAKINERVETYQVVKDLDELETLVSLALVEFIPYNYKEDFRHFYFNFVHPIQLQISKSKNYEFLNRNVNSLNFAINLLNMNLTKRNKKTPEGMGSYLAVIHNRWNSLLRYYF